MRYLPELAKQLMRHNKCVIFGARIVAREVATVFMGEPYCLSINAFLVSSLKNNPGELLGLPVREYGQVKEEYRDALIIVAVLERYQGEILEMLHRDGFFNILPLGFESDLWCELRGNYFESQCKRQNRSYLVIEEELGCGAVDHLGRIGHKAEKDLHVYRAQCHLDRPISADFTPYSWEIPIQVGKALTDKKIAAITDADGKDNISEKNSKYSELTALYWIWKNDRARYTGLCHYRRHFCLNAVQREKLISSDIDVVLTIPIMNFPDVRTVYQYDHIQEDWEIMLDVLSETNPEYRSAAEKLQNGNYYYAYNMFIAKREVLEEYCSWLFPMLFASEKRIGERMDRYQGRYAGFLAERLLSIFFLYHNDLKVVHARKHFMEG